VHRHLKSTAPFRLDAPERVHETNDTNSTHLDANRRYRVRLRPPSVRPPLSTREMMWALGSWAARQRARQGHRLTRHHVVVEQFEVVRTGPGSERITDPRCSGRRDRNLCRFCRRGTQRPLDG